MKDLTEATLYPCHLLLGIVTMATASQCLQVFRMRAPCAATMGPVVQMSFLGFFNLKTCQSKDFISRA